MKAIAFILTALFAANGVVVATTIPHCPGIALTCSQSDIVMTPQGCYKCKDGSS